MKQFNLPRWLGMLGVLLLFFIAKIGFAALSGALDEKSIMERLKPEGEVNVVGDTGQAVVQKPSVADADIGKMRYQEFCHICHETGIAGAPKFGDKSEWGPRIKEGIEVMVKRAITGYKAMPPRGTCSNCTDDEIKKTVEYMISNAK